jgi:hypothetical protein
MHARQQRAQILEGNIRMKLINTVMAALTCAVILAVAAPAFAASSPAVTAYGGEGGTQVSQATEQTQSASELPFTGLNVGLLIGLGIVLTGTGIVVRRRVFADK